MPTKQPNIIFFDLDETLVENRTQIGELFASMYDDFSTQLGSESREAFFGVLRPKIGSLWNTMFDGDASPEELLINSFATSIEGLGRHSTQEANTLGEQMFNHFLNKSSNNVVLHHDALETLAALHNAGFKTGIITNGIEALQLGKIHALGLQEKVDHIVVSAQARAHKPHAAVFELALKRANSQPQSAWQIGDHATNDVAGAIRAGMSGVFYDPSNTRRTTAFNDLEVQPTHIISALKDVVDLALNTQ